MSQSKEMCCFCLCPLDTPFTNLFSKSKDGSTHFDKISKSFSQLAYILHENEFFNYTLCGQCCDTIDMKKTVKIDNEMENCNLTFKSNNNEHWREDKEEVVIKSEPFLDNQIKDELVQDFKVSGKVLVKSEDEEVSSFSDNSNIVKLNRKRKKLLKSKHKIKCTKGSNKKVIEEYSLKNLDEISNDNHKNGEELSVQENHGRNGKKQFPCEVCEKSYNNKAQLNLHLHVHTNLKRLCHICGKLLGFATPFNKHMLVHLNDTPYKCNSCKLEFKRKSSLDKHKLTHIGAKPYSCDQCGVRFTVKGSLNEHVLSHLGQKPTYECELCLLTFSKKSNLNRHRICHTGERPFNCDICTKTFTNKSYLNEHKRIHTGEKPYTCDICGKSFNSPSCFNRHKRIHKK